MIWKSAARVPAARSFLLQNSRGLVILARRFPSCFVGLRLRIGFCGGGGVVEIEFRVLGAIRIIDYFERVVGQSFDGRMREDAEDFSSIPTRCFGMF